MVRSKTYEVAGKVVQSVGARLPPTVGLVEEAETESVRETAQHAA